jgi:rhamnosyltransferase
MGADCFNIDLPNVGPARVIVYDIKAINYGLEMVKSQGMVKPVFLILGHTIGGMISHYAAKIRRAGGIVIVNPDGLEWRRSKWAAPVRKYLKYAERKMVQYADLIVSDNQGIEDYLKDEYQNVNSKVIAYGVSTDEVFYETLPAWYHEKDVVPGEYYLIVGRFVPENNYEAMINAFMASSTSRDLVIITNFEGNAYFDELKAATGFDKDPRVKFVGTVYDAKLLQDIRQQAFAYIHGHEVGGTNPGLLEAMWASRLNLVIDVSFNRLVTGDSALYWHKSDLTALIEEVDTQALDRRELARAIVKREYTWPIIVEKYESLFTREF